MFHSVCLSVDQRGVVGVSGWSQWAADSHNFLHTHFLRSEISVENSDEVTVKSVKYAGAGPGVCLEGNPSFTKKLVRFVTIVSSIDYNDGQPMDVI